MPKPVFTMFMVHSNTIDLLSYCMWHYITSFISINGHLLSESLVVQHL